MLTLEELKEFIQNLNILEESEWSFGGNLRYETEIEGEEIIFDRRNNADKGISECYMKIGNLETIYTQETEEYDLISKFLIGLDDLSEDI